MFKHYFEGILGIEKYPIFGLGVFVLFFVSLLFWVITASKPYINHMQNLPLDHENN